MMNNAWCTSYVFPGAESLSSDKGLFRTLHCRKQGRVLSNGTRINLSISVVLKVSSVMVENSDGENYILANLNQVLELFILILDPVPHFKLLS